MGVRRLENARWVQNTSRMDEGRSRYSHKWRKRACADKVNVSKPLAQRQWFVESPAGAVCGAGVRSTKGGVKRVLWQGDRGAPAVLLNSHCDRKPLRSLGARRAAVHGTPYASLRPSVSHRMSVIGHESRSGRHIAAQNKLTRRDDRKPSVIRVCHRAA